MKFKLNSSSFSRLAKVASREIVGVELGSHHLKIVKVALTLNSAQVLSVWSRSINGLTDEEISKLLRLGFQELKLKALDVVNVIPSELVITKNIEIPSTNSQEIKDIISLQAGRHTPFSREEIIVDYVEIGVFKNNYTKILLVIVARNVIKRQVQILEQAGLRFDDSLLAAEGIAVCAARALRTETQNAPAAIVHIDENATDFIIVLRGKPLFVRSVSIGALHLSDDRETFETKFIDELKRSLEAYQNEDIEKTPNVLVLCGAVTLIKDLEITLSSMLHLPIKSVDYLSSLSLAPECAKQVNAARRVSFLNVLAPLFCMDKVKVSLVPEEIKLRKAFQQRGRELIKTGIFVLTIAVLIFSIFLTKIYVKGAYLKKLDKKFQVLDKDARNLEAYFTKIDVIKDYLSARGYSLEVLTELYALVTEDLQLSDIRFDEQGKFSLKGTAEAMSSVFGFVQNLEKSKYFKDVKTRYTSKRKEGLKDVTDFEIVSALENKD